MRVNTKSENGLQLVSFNGVQTLVQSSVDHIGLSSGISQTLFQSPILPIGQTGVVNDRTIFLINIICGAINIVQLKQRAKVEH